MAEKSSFMGKKSSFKGKNRVLGFWAKSSFPRNAQKKSLAVYQKTGINLYCKSDVLKPSVECLRDQKPPLGLYASI